MPVKVKPDVYRRTLALLRGGRPQVEVASEVGLSKSMVSVIARENSIKPHYRRASDSLAKGYYNPGAKYVTQWLLTFPPDVIDWLDHSTPDGATMVEVMRAMILDAYHDDPLTAHRSSDRVTSSTTT